MCSAIPVAEPLGERFTFLLDWYHRGGARNRALRYYLVLRGALRDRPDLRAYLVRCRHCRIFFLCGPRNRGREDLGCPFGCADAHRREQSAKRCTAYYQTPAGKVKRARLNARRRKTGGPRNEARVASVESGSEESPSLAAPGSKESEAAPGPRPEAMHFSLSIIEHVRGVTSLIEGVDVSREEVLSMLENVVRQHSILKGGRRAYVLHWLAEHSP